MANEVIVIADNHSSSEASSQIHDHGKAMDGKKQRVVCNYCAKEMSGFYRLKYHLSGVRGDVTPCEKVPQHVKELFRSTLQGKGDRLRKEITALLRDNLPWKRNASPLIDMANKRRCTSPKLPIGEIGGYRSIDFMSENSVKELSLPPSKSIVQKNSVLANLEEEPSSKQKKRSIGRYFYETGHDFNLANSPSFQRMMNDTDHAGLVPTCEELKGWILREEVKKMEEYVSEIRMSWADTGCSILLDGWVDENGRNLVSFFADCPKGTIYLQSVDVSPIVHDVEKMHLLLDKVIDDVGVQNVVQIIAFSTKGWVGAVGKKFMKQFRTLFWTFDASHCVELMLDSIASMNDIREVLENAMTITKFVHGNITMLHLFRGYTNGCDLINPTKESSAMPFLTLENMALHKQNLKAMFESFDWSASTFPSGPAGKRVAMLVEDPSFWRGAAAVTKLVEPLIQCLSFINGDDKPHMGYIYETIDQVKETIQDNCYNDEMQYQRLWDAIDEIWNGHLHSHLHAAGYVFNPNYFYSANFHCDSEIEEGLFNTIYRMVEVQAVGETIIQQIKAYCYAEDDFGRGLSILRRTNLIDSVKWWSKYGGKHPQLQQFAKRILSQTCVGASKYRLNRSLMEKVLAKGNNPVDQKLLTDLAFVHYNMQLQLQSPRSDLKYDLAADGIGPMDDWKVADTQKIHSRDVASSSKMGSTKRVVKEELRKV